jgi:tetratricopeptide (TPR) repeat protein
MARFSEEPGGNPGAWRGWLGQAENNLEDVIRDSSPAEYQAALLNAKANLAALWLDLSRAKGDRIATLTNAQKAFADAVGAIDNNRSPYEWAAVQANLGAVYTELATDATGPDALRHLENAEERYQDAGKVFTQENYPLDWAQNITDLGLVFIEQSRWRERDESVTLLEKAVDYSGKALEVYRHDLYTRYWALTTLNLAYAKRELGRKLADQPEGLQDFKQAVTLSRDALAALPRLESPFDWAMAQRNLGDSLFAQGSQIGSGSNDGRQLIRQSIAAYKKSLEVWNDQNCSYDWRKTRDALQKAEAA